MNHRSLNSTVSYARLNIKAIDWGVQARALMPQANEFQPHERFNTRKKNSMASAYYQFLKAALETLNTLDGQLQFMTTRTGFSHECLRRVLVHLNAQPLFGEEGDLETQARNKGVSVERYAVAMSPLLEMSVQQAQARLDELKINLSNTIIASPVSGLGDFR